MNIAGKIFKFTGDTNIMAGLQKLNGRIIETILEEAILD